MSTPFQDAMQAIDDSAIPAFRDLVAQYPDLFGETGPELLRHAAENNEVEILRILLDGDVDANAVYEDMTPLGAAARKGSLEAAQCLLEHGAAVNLQPTPLAGTPLDEAVTHGWLDLVQYLLERGADPDICCGNPARNALAAARFWRRRDIIEFLESQGVTEITRHSGTPATVAEEEAGPAEEVIQDPQEWFDKTWLPIFERGDDKGLASLSEKNQILFLVGYLLDVLSSSGVFLIFYNPSGRYAREMALALEKIGAASAAKALTAINALFPNGTPAEDAEERSRQVEDLPPEAATHGKELQSAFEEEDVLTKLHQFCTAKK